MLRRRRTVQRPRRGDDEAGELALEGAQVVHKARTLVLRGWGEGWPAEARMLFLCAALPVERGGAGEDNGVQGAGC